MRPAMDQGTMGEPPLRLRNFEPARLQFHRRANRRPVRRAAIKTSRGSGDHTVKSFTDSPSKFFAEKVLTIAAAYR
jgi:hypothetical protein